MFHYVGTTAPTHYHLNWEEKIKLHLMVEFLLANWTELLDLADLNRDGGENISHQNIGHQTIGHLQSMELKLKQIKHFIQ